MIEEQSRKTILIVDDAPENLDLLSGILKSTYRVKVAKSGEHALKVIAKSAPDLILLDKYVGGLSQMIVLKIFQSYLSPRWSRNQMKLKGLSSGHPII
jgi:putative two-component system response regulator